jgi:hypothetical protein
MKMEQTECSETLAFELQTPGNNPKENLRHSRHGESLKSRNAMSLLGNFQLIQLCGSSIASFTVKSNDNIQMGLKEIAWNNVGCFYVVQNVNN